MRAHGGQRALRHVLPRAHHRHHAHRDEDQARREREDRLVPVPNALRKEVPEHGRAEDGRADGLQDGQRAKQLADVRRLAGGMHDAQRERVRGGNQAGAHGRERSDGSEDDTIPRCEACDQYVGEEVQPEGELDDEKVEVDLARERRRVFRGCLRVFGRGVRLRNGALLQDYVAPRASSKEPDYDCSYANVSAKATDSANTHGGGQRAGGKLGRRP